MKRRFLCILVCTLFCVCNACSSNTDKYPIINQTKLESGLYTEGVYDNDCDISDFATTCLMRKLSVTMGLDQKPITVYCNSINLSTTWLMCGTGLTMPADYYQQLEDYYASESDNYGLITYDDEMGSEDWYYDVVDMLNFFQFCEERNLDYAFTSDMLQLVEEERDDLSLDTEPVKFYAIARASYMMQKPISEELVKEYIENYIKENLLNHTMDYIVLADFADLSVLYGITIDNADDLVDTLENWMHKSSDLTSYGMIARTYKGFQISDSELESEILDVIKQNKKKLLRNDGTYNIYINQQYSIQSTCEALYLSEQSGQSIDQTPIEEEFQYQIEESYDMCTIEDLYYLSIANDRYLHLDTTDMETYIGELAETEDDELTVREMFCLYEMCQMYGLDSPQWIQNQIDIELDNIDSGTETDYNVICLVYLMEKDWAEADTISQIQSNINGIDLTEVANGSILSVLLTVSVMDEYGITVDTSEVLDILDQYKVKEGYRYVSSQEDVTMYATMCGAELMDFCKKGESITIY